MLRFRCGGRRVKPDRRLGPRELPEANRHRHKSGARVLSGPGYNCRMLNAFFRALGDPILPPIRKVIALSLAIAIATFIVLWIVVALTLSHLPIVGWRAVNWLIDTVGAVGVLFLSWLLFPPVVTMIMGLFLERVAAAVEAVHYPGRGPPHQQ